MGIFMFPHMHNSRGEDMGLLLVEGVAHVLCGAHVPVMPGKAVAAPGDPLWVPRHSDSMPWS